MIVEVNKYLINMNEVSRIRNFGKVIIVDYIDKSKDYTVLVFDYNHDISTAWCLLKKAYSEYKQMKILTESDLEENNDDV